MHLKIISAGAGSGKTYRLTSEMVRLIKAPPQDGGVRASGIIATTFTKKAAAELQERVRVRLLEEGLSKEANDLANALIGTVHGLGVKLLKRFAFEAGVSPEVDIIADEDQQVMFNQSLATVLTNERVEDMERLASRLGLNKSDMYKTDWRRVLKDLTEVGRANDFSAAVLDESKQRSWESFQAFLTAEGDTPPGVINWNEAFDAQLEDTISVLENNADSTKTTADVVKSLKEMRGELMLRGEVFWHQWVKITKMKVGAKSRDDYAPLVEFANKHLHNPAFQKDVKSFIFNIFDIAKAAIEEYDGYKKRRGLIDYTDMEVMVKRLLDDEVVKTVLKEEIDLLMVDEFQDTSPMQLEIFVKLSRLARHSIWVGDPKQSIYGFRGAEPALMEAIVKSQGGLQKENILEHSWRSREDIVFACNAIFTKAFSHLPPEQVALLPKRKKEADDTSANRTDEPLEMDNALIHWHFRYDGEGRQPGKDWLNGCMAETLRTHLERGMMILPKGEKAYRQARPGDVAILCRSNSECRQMADALHRAGLKAAISRSGLLVTAEAKLILACLKFILNKYDSLSIAEILLLAERLDIEEIIEDRLVYLQMIENEALDFKWGEQFDFIKRLHALRLQVAELSGAEILTLLLEDLDLRRIIVSWGKTDQRLANVDVLCSLAKRYEENCNRFHSAASLGGFLLWLNDLETNDADMQGSGESSDAVNVLTYHRSKGLEYPVVICHALENQLKSDVWGISIVPEKEDVDLENLLGHRWLRYWVNPYADQFRNTLLEERINASEAKAVKTREALAEEARLLYVGLTRARDYLVFPTRQKPPVWLNRTFNGNEEAPALDSNSGQTLWEWNDEPQPITTDVFHFPESFPYTEFAPETVFFEEKRAGRMVHLLYALDPLKDVLYPDHPVYVGNFEHYASPLQLPEVPERQLVAKALIGFLATDRLKDEEKLRRNLAMGLINRFEVDGLVEVEAMMKLSEALFLWLKQKFAIKRVWRLYPLRLEQAGRLFDSQLDLLLETQDGMVAVLHSPFMGEGKGQQKKARELAPVLQYLKAAVGQGFGTFQVRLFVHFVLYGTIVEVEV